MTTPYELTLRAPETTGQLLPLFQEFGIQQAHLTHANDHVDRIQAIETLRHESPRTEFSLTLSTKFLNPTSLMAEFERAYAHGVRRFLIVSGYPKTDFDACKALELLSRSSIPSDVEFACVYNPYLEPEEQELERERLRRKLDSGIISSVYFQIGMDQERLENGISLIRALDTDLQLFGEFVIPNPMLLDRLKQKPWHGVALDTYYLSDLTHAEQETNSLKYFYHQHRVTPLVLVLPFTRQHLAHAQSMIRS